MAIQKLNKAQLQTIRDHIAANPEHSAMEVANYFERVSDVDYAMKLTITSVAAAIKNGQEQDLPSYVNEDGGGA